MLPAHLAENIRKQVLFYLQSTLNFPDKGLPDEVAEQVRRKLFNTGWSAVSLR